MTIYKDPYKTPKRYYAKKSFAAVVVIFTLAWLVGWFIFFYAIGTLAGGRTHKTKIRYKCWRGDVRVPCPKGLKQSAEFKAYLRAKKARLHDTRRHLMSDEQIPTHRTYIESSERTYYDETIRED